MNDNIKVSDQLGAMAIVEELRRNQQLIDQNLAFPKQREQVVQRIREHYAAQGQQVSDELIEQGVRQYFMSRLDFSHPPLSTKHKLLASAYLFRGQLLIGFLALFILLAIVQMVSQGNKSTLAQKILKQRRDIASIWPSARNQQEYRLEKIQCNEMQYSQKICANLLVQAKEKLQEVTADTELQTALNIPILNNQGAFKVKDTTAGQQQLEQITATSANLSKQLDISEQFITQAEHLVQAEQQLQALEKTDNFEHYYNNVSRVQLMVNDIRASLEQGTYNSGRYNHSQLRDLLEKIQELERLKKEGQQLSDQLQKMIPDPLQSESIQRAQNNILTALDQLDLQLAKESVQQLEKWVNFANTSLTLRIVDRQGVKSGIERTYDESGGKAWYLVVEAIGSDGEMFPMLVKNDETGVVKGGNMFAIRVTEQTYQKVKNDKLADGHIDHAVMGKKAAGQMTFKYQYAVLPGTITEW